MHRLQEAARQSVLTSGQVAAEHNEEVCGRMPPSLCRIQCCFGQARYKALTAALEAGALAMASAYQRADSIEADAVSSFLSDLDEHSRAILYAITI